MRKQNYWGRNMLESLKELKLKYIALGEALSQPEAMADQAKWREQVKEHARLSEIVTAYDELQSALASVEECKAIIETESDSELRQLAEMELSEAKARVQSLEEEIKLLLLPSDPNDERNVIIEIRAGTGGDEAALFGANLLRMYQRYAERHGYRCELMSSSITEIGGVKEAVLSINGHGAYSRLKYESGVHRVQRVPETEAQGRIHTSAATVAVLPEADDVEVELNMNDLRIDTYRSSGAGGQHVNKTESAIRITHIPTGIVVQCQDEKSQLKNKEQALKVLRARLYDLYRSQQEAELSGLRKSQVGSGDRSQRIRTYNFPQGRVSDHRINMTLYKLESFLDGDMDEIIDALIVDDRTKRLAEASQ